MATDEKCGNCYFWYRGDAGNTGLCRENPGQVCFVGFKPNLITQEPEPQLMSAFITRHQDSWCGRWKPKLN